MIWTTDRTLGVMWAWPRLNTLRREAGAELCLGQLCHRATLCLPSNKLSQPCCQHFTDAILSSATLSSIQTLHLSESKCPQPIILSFFNRSPLTVFLPRHSPCLKIPPPPLPALTPPFQRQGAESEVSCAPSMGSSDLNALWNHRNLDKRLTPQAHLAMPMQLVWVAWAA